MTELGQALAVPFQASPGWAWVGIALLVLVVSLVILIESHNGKGPR